MYIKTYFMVLLLVEVEVLTLLYARRSAESTSEGQFSGTAAWQTIHPWSLPACRLT